MNPLSYIVNAGVDEVHIVVSRKDDEMKSTIKKALSQATGAQAKKAEALLAGFEEHPVMWSVADRILTRRYERETGKSAKADPSSFLDWLVANLPEILKILAMILSFLAVA